MANNAEWLKRFIDIFYDNNSYVKLLGMRITKLGEDQAELSMSINADKHTNVYAIAHGGALASLADTVMGVACSTTGKRVVTLEMNMNFIKEVRSQAEIKASGKVIHNGKSTMIVEAEIIDSDNNLIAKGRGTFLVTGFWEES